MAAPVHGKVAVVKFNSTDISQYLAQASIDQNVDTSDVSTFGASAHTHIPGLVDNGEIQFQGPYDPTIHGVLTAVLGATAAQAGEVDPAGTTTGNPKATFSCTLSEYKLDLDITAANAMTFKLKIRGAVTWAVN